MHRTVFFAALLLASSPAWAQNPQPAAPADPDVHVAPPGTGSTPPEKIAPPDGTLSARLSQQRGTIVPRANVDPGITVTPPANGNATAAVIPPPGSPGGDRSVVPK
jgi:hypothetical protein